MTLSVMARPLSEPRGCTSIAIASPLRSSACLALSATPTIPSSSFRRRVGTSARKRGPDQCRPTPSISRVRSGRTLPGSSSTPVSIRRSALTTSSSKFPSLLKPNCGWQSFWELPPRALHRVGGFIAGERASQIVLDLLLGLPAILLTELHPDTGGALALRALRCHPDHATGDGELLVLAHEVQEHEHLVAEAIVAVRRDEESTILHEWHIGEI